MSPCERRKIKIVGTGHAVPAQVVTSEMLDTRLGLPPGTVQARTGVSKRHFVSREENAAILGACACKKALNTAGIGLADIDLIVSAGGAHDQALPCDAAHILHELDPNLHIQVYDVNSACMSFIAALDLLSWPIAAGHYRNVLIVSSDIASCALDWSHLESSGIFGDGAAAAVVSAAGENESAILASSFQTYTEGIDYCRILGGGTRYHPTRLAAWDKASLTHYAYFQMDGKRVFKLAAEKLPPFVNDLLDAAGLRMADLDCIIPHQASLLALRHMDRHLGWNPEKVVNIFSDYGNQIAASLPTALHIARTDGRLRPGMKALMLGTGAGLTIGGVVMEV